VPIISVYSVNSNNIKVKDMLSRYIFLLKYQDVIDKFQNEISGVVKLVRSFKHSSGMIVLLMYLRHFFYNLTQVCTSWA
jgi:hypothetical protein